MYKLTWTMYDGKKHSLELTEEEAYWNPYDCENFLKNKGAVEVTIYYNGTEIDNYLQRSLPFDFPGILASFK